MHNKRRDSLPPPPRIHYSHLSLAPDRINGLSLNRAMQCARLFPIIKSALREMNLSPQLPRLRFKYSNVTRGA